MNKPLHVKIVKLMKFTCVYSRTQLYKTDVMFKFLLQWFNFEKFLVVIVLACYYRFYERMHRIWILVLRKFMHHPIIMLFCKTCMYSDLFNRYLLYEEHTKRHCLSKSNVTGRNGNPIMNNPNSKAHLNKNYYIFTKYCI